MKRLVESELLDELPARDPRAARSRRDIQRLNLLTGHHRIMANALNATLDGRSLRLAELGAGNGRFLLSVAQRLTTRPKTMNAILVDRADGFDPEIYVELKHLGWNLAVEITDALDWLQQSTNRRANKPLTEKMIEVIATNQFLHQFETSVLAEMFRLAADSADVLIAVEPRRGIWPLLCSHFVGLVGCGPVTRYDAPVSVRAGFKNHELSALWPDQKNWELSERRAGWFSHLFIAKRKLIE